MNESQFADTYLREIKIKNREIEAKICPFCGGGQHADLYTFSINTDKHTYNCLRGKCGERGTFKELCERYNEQADYYLEWLKDNNKEYKSSQEYKQPKYKVNELSVDVMNYFINRGITSQTLDKAKVKSINKGYAVFQFFEGEKLVMNKIRLAREPKVINGKKELKEWKEPGGKHILWNMNDIDTDKPVILTEGMIDALSVIEAGESNVVSIPSGTNDLTWIENCYDWIQKVKEWIVYVDNDAAGQKLTKELSIKFKSYKTRIVTHELKDANEELTTFGKDYILTVIKKADFPVVEGIDNLANIDIVDPSKMERCLTGVSILDKFAGGYIFPSLNIWTGERGSGKSTVLSQTLLNCIDKGYKVFIYSGELMSGFFKLWLYSQAVGEKNVVAEIDPDTNVTSYKPKKDIIPIINKWIDGKAYIYNDTNTNEEDKVLQLMEEAYKRYNCRVFVIDNLMTVKFNRNKDIYRAQSDFVDRLRLFTKNNDVIVNIVVHPNKSGEVGGAGDIRNAAFNEFWVKKLKEDDEDFAGYNTLISITKNRYYGDTDIQKPYMFSKKSKRIYEHKENERVYGWNIDGVTEVYEECPF